MRLLDEIDVEIRMFEINNFIKIIENTLNNPIFEGENSIYLRPLVLCKKTILLKSVGNYNVYEASILILLSESDDNRNPDEAFFEMKIDFKFTNEPGKSQKELFELILNKSDDVLSSHFFSFMENKRKQISEVDYELFKKVMKCDFSIMKYNATYRPIPKIDYEGFFNGNLSYMIS